MKKVLTLILICIPGLLPAQTETSLRNGDIQFVKGLNWDQVKIKAKAENKYIFVDCFATWCGPCKKMDREVYSNDTAANYMNEKFIAVKVQMDTSKQDNEEIKKWYEEGHRLEQQYNVTAFPTFLFFSPEGKIVYKDVGARNVQDFVLLAKTAITEPYKKYYTLLDEYQQNKKDFASMPWLVEMARSLKEKELARTIAQDYLQNYLYRLAEKKLYTYENIKFMGSYIQSSKEKGFKLFYNHPGTIDKIMNKKRFAESVIDGVIINEEILPFAQIASKLKQDPDWMKIKAAITNKFSNEYSERAILKAQLNWYHYRLFYDGQKKSDEWKSGLLKIIHFDWLDKYRLDTVVSAMVLGNLIEEVVLPYSNDEKILNKATRWMEIVMKNYPGIYYSNDYAGLLYRTGYPKQGIAWQEMYLKLVEYDAIKAKKNINDDKSYREQLEILGEMKKGEKIWPRF